MNNTHLEQTKNTSSLLKEKDIKSLRKLNRNNRKSTSLLNNNYYKIEQKLSQSDKNEVFATKKSPRCNTSLNVNNSYIKRSTFYGGNETPPFIKRLQYEDKKISPKEKNYVFRKEDIPIIKHLLKRGELIDTKNNLSIDLNLCKRTRRNSMDNN